MENGAGTNPEELIGAAHAGCFSMALAFALASSGHPATRVHTTAKVQFGPADGGFAISGIDLATEAEVPGLDDADVPEAGPGRQGRLPRLQGPRRHAHYTDGQTAVNAPLLTSPEGRWSACRRRGVSLWKPLCKHENSAMAA